MIIEIDELAENIRNNILAKTKINKYKLVSVALDPDKSTIAYLNSQKNLSKKLNVEYDLILTKNKHDLIEIIKKLNNDETVNGIFLAQPLPFDPYEVIPYIDPKKDIEGITPYNLGNLIYGKSYFLPCTADSAIRILNSFTNPDGKSATVIGRSVIVGIPVSVLLSNKENNATVTICHSHTKNLKNITLNADIIIVAAGTPDLIKKDMVKKESIVIDVGINVQNGHIVGDVAKDVKEIAYVTEVPGGVGEITSLILFENLTKTI